MPFGPTITLNINEVEVLQLWLVSFRKDIQNQAEGMKNAGSAIQFLERLRGLNFFDKIVIPSLQSKLIINFGQSILKVKLTFFERMAGLICLSGFRRIAKDYVEPSKNHGSIFNIVKPNDWKNSGIMKSFGYLPKAVESAYDKLWIGGELKVPISDVYNLASEVNKNTFEKSKYVRELKYLLNVGQKIFKIKIGN